VQQRKRHGQLHKVSGDWKVLNVICLKWGNRYSAKDVNRLRYMVSQNLNIPHRFICVTEDNEGIESGIDIIDLPKEPELKYWWNKLKAHYPD